MQTDGTLVKSWICPRPDCGECEAEWMFCPRCGQHRMTIPSADDLRWLGNHLHAAMTSSASRFGIWNDIALEAWKILVFPRRGFMVEPKSTLSSPSDWDRLSAANTSLRCELEIFAGVRDQLKSRVEDLRSRIGILGVVMLDFKGKVLAVEAILRDAIAFPTGGKDNVGKSANVLDAMAIEIQLLLVTLDEQADKDLKAEAARVLDVIPGVMGGG